MDDLRNRARQRARAGIGLAGSGRVRARVLIVGPVSDTGGMARVARLTTHGLDPDRFNLAVCDTAKDTPPGRSAATAYWSHLRRAGRLVRRLHHHRPDLVHIHTCSFGTFHRTVIDALTCRIWRTPYVLHVHGGLFEEFLRGLSGWRRRIVVSTLHHAERVVVLGETWRAALEKLAPRALFTVIPNAVNVAPESNGSGPRGAGVLFVGDLSEVKRPEDALVAFSALPGELRRCYPLSMVGAGSEERSRRLAKLARRLDVERDIRFLGPQPHDAVERLMASADLLLMTSRAEGMPMVLLEAMRAGLPIVATTVGAVPEMLTHDVHAELVRPGDTLNMALAMKRMLSDEARRISLARAARERVEDLFSSKRFHGVLEALWSEIAALHARPATALVPKLAATSLRSIL